MTVVFEAWGPAFHCPQCRADIQSQRVDLPCGELRDSEDIDYYFRRIDELFRDSNSADAQPAGWRRWCRWKTRHCRAQGRPNRGSRDRPL